VHRNYFALDRPDSRQLAQILSTWQGPRALLAHYGSNGLGCLPVASRLGVPVIVHFHGFDLSVLLRDPLYLSSLKQHLRSFSAAVVVNQDQRQRLLELGAEESRVSCIPCGVPMQETLHQERSDREVRLVSVGRFVEKKAPLLVLESVAPILERRGNVTLTMIGDGPLLAACRSRTLALGLNDKVRFLGARGNREVIQILSRSDIFIQHSLTAPNGDKEGWPVSIAEACAAGLPIVATRHAGIPDQVSDGSNGYLVEEGDVEGMRVRVCELVRCPSLRKSMGAAGRVKAYQEFSHEKQLAALESVLCRFLSDRAPVDLD
jgi:glycosyltransferase involved in cell wall biosynthesis